MSDETKQSGASARLPAWAVIAIVLAVIAVIVTGTAAVGITDYYFPGFWG